MSIKASTQPTVCQVNCRAMSVYCLRPAHFWSPWTCLSQKQYSEFFSNFVGRGGRRGTSKGAWYIKVRRYSYRPLNNADKKGNKKYFLKRWLTSQTPSFYHDYRGINKVNKFFTDHARYAPLVAPYLFWAFRFLNFSSAKGLTDK